MNRTILFSLFAAAFAITSLRSTGADHTNATPIYPIKASRLDNKSSRELIFLIDGTEINDTDALKALVAKLPTGSKVSWNSGCFWYRTLPLRGPKVTPEQFTAFCREHGIEFHYYFGY